MIRCRPGDAAAPVVGLELGARCLGVEHVADVDTMGGELIPRSLHVGDDQVDALGRTGRGRRDLRAELDRAPRAGWGELDDPEAVIEREVGVEPPPELPVELLRAVDVRDRDDDHLQLHIDVLLARRPARITAGLCHAHTGLPRSVDNPSRALTVASPTRGNSWCRPWSVAPHVVRLVSRRSIAWRSKNLRQAAAKEPGGFTVEAPRPSPRVQGLRPDPGRLSRRSARGHRPAGEAGVGKSAPLSHLLERVSEWNVPGTNQGPDGELR